MRDNQSNDYCSYPRCRNLSTIIYYEHPLCDRHWELSSEKLREVFGLPKLGAKPKISLKGFKRKELRRMCRDLGVDYDRAWDRKILRREIRKAMRSEMRP